MFRGSIEHAYQLIKEKDFSAAEKLLKELKTNGSQAGEANFYLGLATLGNTFLQRTQVIKIAAGYFKASARAGYHLPSGDWEDFPIRRSKITTAIFAAARKYVKSEDPREIEIAANLLLNIIAVDSKAHDANRKLGELYLRTGQTSKAIGLYRQILEANPEKNQNIYSLDLNFMDIYLPEQATPILDCFSSEKPESLSPLEKLFIARSLFALGKDSLACNSYYQCLDSLDEVTAGELLRDITDVVFEQERQEYENAITMKEKQVFFRRFWKSRDPSTTSSYNGRLVEHYRRLNFAKTFYNIRMLNGYDARGRIYIKHGEPDQKASEPSLLSGNESWMYYKNPKNFIFHFLREFTNYRILHNLPPSLYESRGELDPIYFQLAMQMSMAGSYTDIAQLKMDEAEILLPAFTLGETTETYNPYRGIKPLDYYFYTADFMSLSSNSSLYVYYGVPLNKLEARTGSSGSFVNYECVFTLYDSDWNEAAKEHDEHIYKLNRDSESFGKGSLVVEKQVLDLPPGKYSYTVNVKDLNSGHLGLYKDTIEVSPYVHGRFNVSQAVLATDIIELEKGARPGKFTRGKLNVMALPSCTFSRNQKVFIYYEIYYLDKDSQGNQRYNVDFSVKADKLDRGLVSKVFTPFGKLIGRKKDEGSITMTFDKEQKDPGRVIQPEYISIDISDSPPGTYNLRITVTNVATGEQVTRDTNFSIVK